MSSSKQKHTVTTEVDDWGRKKFKLEQQGSDEEPQPENQTAVEVGRNKAMLLGRQENLNIEKYMGRVEKNKKNRLKEVFYCEVCKEGFKCDMAYITHLNSPQHNRKLGMSMKVKASSVQDVQAKLMALKRQKDPNFYAQEQQDKKSQEQAVKKEQEPVKEEAEQEDNVQQEEEEEQQNLEDMLKACGLPSSFGSKKQKR